VPLKAAAALIHGLEEERGRRKEKEKRVEEGGREAASMPSFILDLHARKRLTVSSKSKRCINVAYGGMAWQRAWRAGKRRRKAIAAVATRQRTAHDARDQSATA